MRPKVERPLLFFLPSEEASALINLGAALEPFIDDRSPADMATAHMDEQYAQQARTIDQIVDAVRDELEDALYEADIPEPFFETLTARLPSIAARLVNTIHGLYEGVALTSEEGKQ